VSEAQRKRNARIYLDWVMSKVMEMHTRLPALGAGLVLNGELVYAGVRGVRRRGHASAATLDDRFHLGSVSKPLTGYLMAVLKKQGKLSWTRTLDETFPDLFAALPGALGNVPGRDDWVAHYRNTTLADLMRHTAGFDSVPSIETNEAFAAISSTVDAQLRTKRRLFTAQSLRDRPYLGWAAMPGNNPPQKYSGGSIIAASMAEEITGRSWENLLSEQVFGPLGMTRWAIGTVSTANSLNDLWWHRVHNGQIESSVGPHDIVSQIAYTHAPAGAVSLSIPSWGQWAKALLAGSDNAHMSRAVLDEYFHLAPGYNCSQGGWFGGGGSFAHDGNNGWTYASMLVDRNRGMATLAATNISYEGVTEGLYAMREEMERLADAWPAMEHLSESLALDELSCSANSSASGAGATLMADTWFRTRWASATSTPTITVTLQSERLLKGIALCQRGAAAINGFELEVQPEGTNGMAMVLAGSALAALTSREGCVIKVLFATPMRAKRLVLRIKSASAAPSLTRLMVMTHEKAILRSFDISSSGALWTTDHADRVLTTGNALGDGHVVMDHDTGGEARQVRRAAGKLWVIGKDGKLWRGESDGWFPIGGSPDLLRIAVDETNDRVWFIDSQRAIRNYGNGVWRVHPGQGLASDIVVHDGKAWVVGSDGIAYASTATGWTRMNNNPGPLRRLALDRANLKLWALVGEGRIFSRAAGASFWVEHPQAGRGKEIAVHAGLPYVIGNDNGLWRSAGDAGWQSLSVLQPRG